MSADARLNHRPVIAPQPKPAERDKVPPASKDREIESIKRTLYNAIDKLDRLTAR